DARVRLEEALLAADVGPGAAERLIERSEKLLERDAGLDLRAALERTAAEILGSRRARFEPAGERPWVALLVGVNGMGKSPLAGKLAGGFALAGRQTLLVAADTFRAAATEQLEGWAERTGVQVVRARPGADPAAVVHDALEAACARGHEIVMIDTAGRLHTKHNLMAELGKVARVCSRLVPGAPHHVLLVLDATLGQNALEQAREFRRAVPVTSLAVPKLDGTARGGVGLAIAGQRGRPISVGGPGGGLGGWGAVGPGILRARLFEV